MFLKAPTNISPAYIHFYYVILKSLRTVFLLVHIFSFPMVSSTSLQHENPEATDNMPCIPCLPFWVKSFSGSQNAKSVHKLDKNGNRCTRWMRGKEPRCFASTICKEPRCDQWSGGQLYLSVHVDILYYVCTTTNRLRKGVWKGCNKNCRSW